MTTKNVRVVAYLEPSIATRLRVLAAKRGIRVTVLLRKFVADGLDQLEQ